MSRKRIFFPNSGNLRSKAFTYADRARFVHDRRSTSVSGSIIGTNVVTWRSIKETVVARSSAETEYKAVAYGICHLMLLQLSSKYYEIDD